MSMKLLNKLLKYHVLCVCVCDALFFFTLTNYHKKECFDV